MAADKVGLEQQKLEPRGTAAAAAFADSHVQFKILQFPAKCAAAEVLQSCTAAGLQTSSPSVMVIAKAAPPAAGPKGQAQITKAVLSQVASINQLPTSGRTVMITVPRSAAPQTLAVTPQLPPSASPQPANIQIPPGEGGLPCLLLITSSV